MDDIEDLLEDDQKTSETDEDSGQSGDEDFIDEDAFYARYERVGVHPWSIGRDNPPRNEHAIWKPGQSGNPKGRPPNSGRKEILNLRMQTSTKPKTKIKNIKRSQKPLSEEMRRYVIECFTGVDC